MNRSFTTTILGVAVIAQIALARAQPPQNEDSLTLDGPRLEPAALSVSPVVPRGRSTILGGVVQDIDRVRDEFSLHVYGQRPMKVLFDERTRLYLDGKQIPLRELRPNDHGSVQTVLEGTVVFALSIHLLARAPEGEYQGQVLEYNAATRILTVSSGLSREPFTLHVPSDTPISLASQMTSHPVQPRLADLSKGTLVSLTFVADRRGGGVASGIVILASPKSEYVFNGELTSIDMHSGILVLFDPRNDESHQIECDPALIPSSRMFHEGDNVRVTASFDGSRYQARIISAE